MTDQKRRAYRWGGAVLGLFGAATAFLNVSMGVPEYQRVSWLLVGFFVCSGIGGLCVGSSPSCTGGRLVEYAEALIVAILLAIAIRGGIVQAFKIPSGSMLPTLQIGDHLLVTKLLYGPRIPYTGARLFRLRAPRRGDVVVFAYPQDDGKDFIKRVIGQPGEVVEVRQRRVFINGKAIDDPWGHYLDGDSTEGKGENYGPVTVPQHQYFVMGDNRDRSYDSRFWGFVEDARIRGKAFVLYWSWNSESDAPFWSLWQRVRWRRLGSLIH